LLSGGWKGGKKKRKTKNKPTREVRREASIPNGRETKTEENGEKNTKVV